MTFNPTTFEPLRAYNGDYTFPADIKLPCYVLPKYDGIRVCHLGTTVGWMTSKFKQIPSRSAQEFLRSIEFASHLDAELLVCHRTTGMLPYNDIQSVIMSADGKPPSGADWMLRVFDVFASPELPFNLRYSLLLSAVESNTDVRVGLAPLASASTPTELTQLVELYSTNYEGAIIRCPSGRYKFGRSTLREQLVLKYCLMRREEGILTGYTENGTHPDRIGAMVVQTDQWGSILVGTGFDHKLSREIRRGEHRGKMLTYEYKPHGMKSSPRQPSFVGWRGEGV